jgi:hypothetical protein
MKFRAISAWVSISMYASFFKVTVEAKDEVEVEVEVKIA